MKRCKIFLSYNSADRDCADRLALELERLGLEVWCDKWKIVPGDSLSSSVAKGIDKADIFAFVLSPASVASPWPQEELRAALAARMAKPQFRIVPILRKPCRIPVFLRDYRRIRAVPGRRYHLIAQEFAGLLAHLGFSVAGVPSVIREAKPFFNLYSASRVRVVMAFHAPRGESTIVSEQFTVTSRQRRLTIRRRIACAGTVSRLRVSPGTLEQKRLLPGTIAVKLRFTHARWRTDPFAYFLNYELRNAFGDKDDFWFYNFQTAIQQFTYRLVFDQPVKYCRCFRYQGEVERESYPMQRTVIGKQTQYDLNLANPPYLEGVIFKWRWLH